MPIVQCSSGRSAKYAKKFDRVTVITTFDCENKGLAKSNSATYAVFLNYIVMGGPVSISKIEVDKAKTEMSKGCWEADDCFFISPELSSQSKQTISVTSEVPASIDDKLLKDGQLFSLSLIGPN